MEFLQELFLTACMAVVLSLIVAISIAFSGGEEKTSSLEGVSLVDKRLKFVGGKRKKKVRFADDVVDRDVEEEPSKDLNFMEKFDGILAKSLEEEILRDEVNIVNMLDEFEYGGVDKKAGLMVSGGKIVEEIGNVNLVMKVKPDVVEEKACDGVGLIDEVLEKGIEEEKSGYAKVCEFNDLEENSLVDSGLEMLAAAEEMQREEIDSRTGLEMVNDDVSIDQKGVEVGGKDAISAVLLGQTLERGAVEEKTQSTVVNFDTDGGAKETELPAVDVGLENLSVGEISRTQPLGGESEVGRLNNDAIYENEKDGVFCVKENNVVGIKEDLGKASMVEEDMVRDGEFEEEQQGGVDDMDDDDWEGIERTELEKVFAEAVNYVEYGGKGKDYQLTNLGSDVQMQLFGLHKLAVEGPCYEPQPMALKVSARAKWNSWQRLGSMSPELAMEQYINLLSETDPDWAYHPDAGDGKDGFIQSGAAGAPDINLSVPKELQADTKEDGRSQDKEQKAGSKEEMPFMC